MKDNQTAYLKELGSISLLSVTTGQLEIARIPVVGGPDWIIPRSLVLAIDPFNERIWTYIWRGQEVPVFQLLPKNMQSTHLVVIESITDVHRVALQIQGEVRFQKVRIADVQDVENLEKIVPVAEEKHDDTNVPMISRLTDQDFIFQEVMIQNELCVVPDLDKLSHYLVDLDS